MNTQDFLIKYLNDNHLPTLCERELKYASAIENEIATLNAKAECVGENFNDGDAAALAAYEWCLELFKEIFE